MSWPAPSEALSRGRKFLLEETISKPLIASSAGVDGLAGSVLIARALEKMGRSSITILPEKGENAASSPWRSRIKKADPGSMIVIDMGSRGETVFPTIPTLVLDYHRPRSVPVGAIAVSTFGCEPVAPSSLLAFVLMSSLVDMEDHQWLATLAAAGAAAHEGSTGHGDSWGELAAHRWPARETSDRHGPMPDDRMRSIFACYGRRHVSEAASLLNAARAASAHDVALAHDVLMRARGPMDISLGRIKGVDRLRAFRSEVASEVTRCARPRPVIAGRVALCTMRSGAAVHPMVAQRWAGRLRDSVVIAANFDHQPGKVCVAIRTNTRLNLIEFLQRVGAPVSGEVAHGRPEATGGTFAPGIFLQLARTLGFSARDVDHHVQSVH